MSLRSMSRSLTDAVSQSLMVTDDVMFENNPHPQGPSTKLGYLLTTTDPASHNCEPWASRSLGASSGDLTRSSS